MGNTDARRTEAVLKSFDAYAFSAEFNELTEKKMLADTRLFKTLRFGSSLVNFLTKIHICAEDLRKEHYQQNFDYFQEKCKPTSHYFLLFYKNIVYNSENQYFLLMRQYIEKNLHDQLHYIFALNNSQKLWIILQLLLAVYDLHKTIGLFHGDLKSSNILVTSKNQILLTDFGFFKPFYIDETNLNSLSFFYPNYTDRCNLAPEKLTTNAGLLKKKMSSEHTLIKDLDNTKLNKLKKMDIFSLGCIIAEILCDSQPLFTYENLQKYKRDISSKEDIRERLIKSLEKSKKSKNSQINEFEKELVDLILHMISKKPKQRYFIEDYLNMFINNILTINKSKIIIPFILSVYNPIFMFPDYTVALTRILLPSIVEEFASTDTSSLKRPLPLPLQGTHIIKLFESTYEVIDPSLKKILGMLPFTFEKDQTQVNFLQVALQSEQEFSFEKGANLQIKSLRELIEKNLRQNRFTSVRKRQSLLSDEISYNLERYTKTGYKAEALRLSTSSKNNESKLFFSIIQLLCSQLRNLSYENSKIVCLEMITFLSKHISQNKNLRYVLPYFSQMINSKESSGVTFFALQCIFKVLETFINPFRILSDSTMLHEFCRSIFELFDYQRPMNKNLLVKNMHILLYSELLCSYLNENSEQLKMNEREIKDRYMNRIREIIRLYEEKNPNQQLIDSLSENFQKLCFVLGKHCVESLLDDLTPLFNKNKIKALLAIQSICANISPRIAHQHIKPCIESCIYDSNDQIKLETIYTLKLLIYYKKFNEADIIYTVKLILPCTIYPMRQIRKNAFDLIDDCLDVIGPSIYYCFLAEHVAKYCHQEKKFPVLERGKLSQLITKPLHDTQICQMEEIKLKQVEGKKTNDPEFLTPKEMKSWGVPEKEFYDNFFKKKFTNEEIIYNTISYPSDIRLKSNNQEILQYYLKILMDCLGEIEFGELNEMKLEEEHYYFDKINYLRNIVNKTEDFDLSRIININNSSFIKNMHNMIALHVSAKEILSKSLIFITKNNFEEATSNTKKLGMISYAPNFRPLGLLYTTIKEHTKPITSLQVVENNFLLSSGADGNVKLFSLEKIERDITVKSYATIKAVRDLNNFDTKNEPAMNVKCMKTLNMTNNFVYGTEDGVLDLFKFIYSQKTSRFKLTLQRRYNTQGEVKAIDNFDSFDDKSFVNCFCYANSKGVITVEDFRQKQHALQYKVGPWRGIITSILVTKIPNTIAISTINGYLLLLDLKLNIVFAIYQLKRNGNKVPILSLSNYVSTNDHISSLSMEKKNSYLIINYQSNENEFSIFNFHDDSTKQELGNDKINPCFHFHSNHSQKMDDELPSLPYLESVTNSEMITNFDCDSYTDRIHYSYFLENHSIHSSSVDQTVYQYKTIFNNTFYDIINFYEEPLNKKLSTLKDGWLRDSSSFVNNIAQIYSTIGTLRKVLPLPSVFQENNLLAEIKKDARPYNTAFLTAGNDCCIRYFSIDEHKKKSKTVNPEDNIREIVGFHAAATDEIKRAYKLFDSENLAIVKERMYDPNHQSTSEQNNYFMKFFSGSSSKQGEEKYPGISDYHWKNGFTLNHKEKISNPNHMYGISDIVFLPRYNGTLIATGGEDNLIKIWK